MPVNILNPGPGQRELPVLVTVAIPLKMGDVFFHVTPSGGGHGDPMVRDPQWVLAEVIEEKLSHELALKAYGAVVEHDPPRVDEGAMRELRASAERVAR